ncbi:MAG TPA: hypothetical protein VFR23_13795 [Jiangellaceae bacterium]|nr:hypothetical protein [Jiangellaceae bacterium]
MTSLREQLARKRAHSTSLTFPLGEAGERARSAFEDAQRLHQLAQITAKGDEGAIKRAEQKLKRAQATYEKNSVTIIFRGLTEEERDALVAAHPPTPEQEAKEKEDDVPKDERSLVNKTTFLPAALTIVALDSDLSEQDWIKELASDRWTAGEKNALFVAVVTATNDQPAPGLGKG